MSRTDEPKTVRDLLDARHARGAAVPGGRLIPDGDRLVYVRHEQPQQQQRDGRQVTPKEGDTL